MAEQFMLYTPIHKGIRNRMYRIASEAGKLTFKDKAATDKFGKDFSALVNNIDVHHKSEEGFIHPLLAERVPGGAEKLEEDHREITHLMDNLMENLKNLTAGPADAPKRPAQGLEFYLAYNRFLFRFLEHIDEEEQHIQPILWSLCDTEELVSVYGRLMDAMEPAMKMENIGMIISSVNLDELSTLLKASKALVPPPVFQGVMDMAKKDLSDEEYTELVSRTG